MTVPPPVNAPVVAALADVQHKVFWTDRDDAPRPQPPLRGSTSADLVVVGGGFTGLWTALCAKQAQPSRDVLLLEGHSIGHGGSGRNGGFISASLTHGLAHGQRLWPDEMPLLVALGAENLRDIAQFIVDTGIAAHLRLNGKSVIALNDAHRAALPELRDLHERWGEQADVLTEEDMRADVHSPTYKGGLRIHGGGGLMDPAALVWGLAKVAGERGVRICEHTPAGSLSRSRWGVRITTPLGTVDARQAVLATNGFTPLLRRLRNWMLPIFDHVLVTEPLSASQRRDIGWESEQGLTDMGNQFHYYRLTPDGRILWGGYDAIYHKGNNTDPALERRDASHRLLAAQFQRTFPQLAGLRFTHKWAGIIDSTSRFTPVIGTAMGGRVAYAVGYTGLGTASSRFAALTMLDLLAGERTRRTSLRMVRRKPVPFPPEPVRFPLVQFTRSQLAREDATGQRGLWLRTLDRFGVGFDS